MEQDIIISLGSREPIIEGLLGLVALLVDELPTDLMLLYQVADGRYSRKRLNTNVFTNVRRQIGSDRQRRTHRWAFTVT